MLALERFIADLSPEERDCRIHGVPMALSGLVYKDFDQATHVYRDCPHGWVDPCTPPNYYTIRTLIDPHPKTPHAVLNFATSPTGTTFIFKELFRPGLISDVTDHILAQVDGYFVEDYLVDPIAYVTNPITGTCMADEFYACGLPVSPAPKDLAYGILKTQERWRERDAHGNPTLLVHEGCGEFLWEIDRYIWQHKKEAPVDENDHMMECLYRGVLTGLQYVNNDRTYAKPKPLEISRSSWRSDMSLVLPPVKNKKKLNRYG